MSLIKGGTRWVLFLSSSAEPDHRHVSDLAFGLQCLESVGILSSDIYVYIDGKDRNLLSQLMANGSKSAITIKESKDFFSDQKNNSYASLVMFVTGHGSIKGIDAPQPITPYALLSSIKASPNLQQAAVYLGQCHAGIFNYMRVGRDKSGGNDPEVIFIGATNLHESISSPTQEALIVGPFSWVANLFLLHVFKWIANPVDVDGDGKLTVMDSYKYAGVLSNDKNKNMKALSFVRSIDLHEKWVTARQADSANSTLQTQLALTAVQTQYESELAVRYVHQECWILNSIPAQQVEF
jgi:hypothetical protein